MENSHYQRESSSRFREDFLIRSPNTAEDVRRVEAEINAYDRSMIGHGDEQSSEYYNAKIDELNRSLSIDSGINCEVIGRAWIGNDLEITGERGELVSLSDSEFHGFEFMETPDDHSKLRAMLVFTKGEDETYYFLPKDVIYAYTDHYVDSEEFAATLKAHSDRHQDIVKSLSKFNTSEQQDILMILSSSPGEYVVNNYGNKEVHIDADLFYKIDYDGPGNKANLVRVERAERHGDLVESPMGVMQGCAFIEIIMADINREDPAKIDQLMENEACIVVADYNDNPTYLVPLSKFNDALEID